MKSIPLTQGQFAMVDDADFEQLKTRKWFCIKHSLKSRVLMYAARGVKRPDRSVELIYMHHQILGPKSAVDHRDGNGLNNQRCNLRTATKAQNGYNRMKQSNCISGFKGVTKATGANRWIASIKVNYKRIYLGCFVSQELAAESYDRAARKYFGEFARFNFAEKEIA